jgi:hypothetical protein
MEGKDEVLKDSARMLRKAARILDEIAKGCTFARPVGYLPKRVSEAVANIDAAKARIYGRTS